MTESKIKVTYSVSLTKTYSYEEIEDFVKDSNLGTDNVEQILNQMIIIDAIDKIRNGGGHFKIIV